MKIQIRIQIIEDNAPLILCYHDRIGIDTPIFEQSCVDFD